MATEQLSNDELRLWARRFDENRERFETLVADLSDEQAKWQPAAGRWSVGECIGHLNVTGLLYQPRMTDAVTGGRQRGLAGTAPYRERTLAGRLLLFLLNPDKLRRAKAPGSFQPAAGASLDLESLLEDFRSVHAGWGRLLADADGLALGRIAFASPVSRLIRINLAEAFEINSIHEARHLGQAERVVASAGFPG